MSDTLYVCSIAHNDGATSRFLSHHPDLFVEWPEEWAPPVDPGEVDAYMAGEDRETVPMKYTKRWLSQIGDEAGWCRGVTFSEGRF